MSALLETLASSGFDVQPLSRAEARRAFMAWCEAFCRSVKLRTGSYTHRGLHWHAFSFALVMAIEHEAAMKQYRDLPVEQVFVIPESWSAGSGALCSGAALPDLTELGADVYVFPVSLEWTMAFTHEQPIHGPFFTWRAWCTVAG